MGKRDDGCFNFGGLCRCDVTYYGRDCQKYAPPQTFTTTGTSREELNALQRAKGGANG